ncbi:MAG: hypothetical protein LH481_17690 [Burkholderiales bacterium]|nr:hypothetical protein [Burkholderiales bacterium]
MKIIAAIFATIALLSAMLGFGMDTLPILSQLGRIAMLLAAAGFTITAVAYTLDELEALMAFNVSDIHP